MGQFTAASIQLSCIFFVYPCRKCLAPFHPRKCPQEKLTMRNLPAVILAYLGQGARLITDGADILPSIFYLSIPGPTSGGLYWITFVMAILATVIASQVKLHPPCSFTRAQLHVLSLLSVPQAMISACFSLIQQLISWRVSSP